MRKKNLKPIIVSSLCAIALGNISVGSTFALFTDKTETTISVTSGIVDVENKLTLVSYESSVDNTNESLDGETEYTNLKVGSSFELDNGNVVINKMVPGDKLTVRLTSKNKSNVKTKTRYVLSHATPTGKKDLMPALKITFGEMSAADLFKWTKHDAASSSDGDALYSLTATIEFVNHDDGIVANTEGRDNQYQDAACSIGLALQSIQANAATSLIDDINNYLSVQEVMEGKNATMHDAMIDVDELNGTVTPKVYTLDVVKDHYAWGVNEDRFIAKAANIENHNYFAVYEEMPATDEQTYSVYAGTNWTAADVAIASIGFDAGNAAINSVSYSNTGDPKNVIIRTNSLNTALTIDDSSTGTIYHYGEAGTLNIIECHTNSYHENGLVAFAEIAKGRIVLESGSEINHIHVNAKEDDNGNSLNEFDTIIIADNGAKALPEAITRDQVDVSEAKAVVRVESGSTSETVYVYPYTDTQQVKTGTTEQTTTQNASIATDLGKLVLDNGSDAGEKAMSNNEKVEAKTEAVLEAANLEVSFDVAEMTLGFNESETIIPNVTTSANYSPTLTWKSSNPAIATVDENGKVTGVGLGSAVITVTAENVSASCQVNVIQEVIKTRNFLFGQETGAVLGNGFVYINPTINQYSYRENGTGSLITNEIHFILSKAEKQIIDNSSYKVLLDLAIKDANGNDLILKPGAFLNGHEYLHVFVNLYQYFTEGYTVSGVTVNDTSLNQVELTGKNPTTGTYALGGDSKDVYFQCQTAGLIEITLSK